MHDCGASKHGIPGRALGLKDFKAFFPKPRRANAMDGAEAGIAPGQAGSLGRGFVAV
jgi:hypothetical protein